MRPPTLNSVVHESHIGDLLVWMKEQGDGDVTRPRKVMENTHEARFRLSLMATKDLIARKKRLELLHMRVRLSRSSTAHTRTACEKRTGFQEHSGCCAMLNHILSTESCRFYFSPLSKPSLNHHDAGHHASCSQIVSLRSHAYAATNTPLERWMCSPERRLWSGRCRQAVEALLPSQ